MNKPIPHPRPGRPITTGRRRRVVVYLSDAEGALLDADAASSGKSPAAELRDAWATSRP